MFLDFAVPLALFVEVSLMSFVEVSLTSFVKVSLPSFVDVVCGDFVGDFMIFLLVSLVFLIFFHGLFFFFSQINCRRI